MDGTILQGIHTKFLVSLKLIHHTRNFAGMHAISGGLQILQILPKMLIMSSFIKSFIQITGKVLPRQAFF